MCRKQVVAHEPDHQGGNDLLGPKFPQGLKKKTPANGFEPKDEEEEAHENGQGEVVGLSKARLDLFPFDPPYNDDQTESRDEESDADLEKLWTPRK